MYERGGLALHAGLKVIPTSAGDKVFMIIGLSGNGKTTTTFTTQNGSKPIQDDFVGLTAGGKASGPRTAASPRSPADPAFEPSIHGAVTKPMMYVENVLPGRDGFRELLRAGYTQNGRAVFEMRDCSRSRTHATSGRSDLVLSSTGTRTSSRRREAWDQAAAYPCSADHGHARKGPPRGSSPRAGDQPALPAAAWSSGQLTAGALRRIRPRRTPRNTDGSAARMNMIGRRR